VKRLALAGLRSRAGTPDQPGKFALRIVRFAKDSLLEGAGFEPSVPLYGELGALGRVRRDPRRTEWKPIVKLGTPDRSRRRARRAICGTPGDGQSRARDRLRRLRASGGVSVRFKVYTSPKSMDSAMARWANASSHGSIVDPQRVLCRRLPRPRTRRMPPSPSRQSAATARAVVVPSPTPRRMTRSGRNAEGPEVMRKTDHGP